MTLRCNQLFDVAVRKGRETRGHMPSLPHFPASLDMANDCKKQLYVHCMGFHPSVGTTCFPPFHGSGTYMMVLVDQQSKKIEATRVWGDIVIQIASLPRTSCIPLNSIAERDTFQSPWIHLDHLVQVACLILYLLLFQFSPMGFSPIQTNVLITSHIAMKWKLKNENWERKNIPKCPANGSVSPFSLWLLPCIAYAISLRYSLLSFYSTKAQSIFQTQSNFFSRVIKSFPKSSHSQWSPLLALWVLHFSADCLVQCLRHKEHLISVQQMRSSKQLSSNYLKKLQVILSRDKV